MSRARHFWQAAATRSITKGSHRWQVIHCRLRLLTSRYETRLSLAAWNERKVVPDGERVGMMVAEHPSDRQRWSTYCFGHMYLPTHVHKGSLASLGLHCLNNIPPSTVQLVNVCKYSSLSVCLAPRRFCAASILPHCTFPNSTPSPQWK
mgnify:CR=1 FL=1